MSSAGHRWRPGQSGNPAGRPRNATLLARAIRDQTGNGDELVEFALATLRDASVRRRDRLDALRWLADRGFGAAPLVVEVSSGDEPPAANYDALDAAELELLVALLDKIEAPPAGSRGAALDLAVQADVRLGLLDPAGDPREDGAT